MPLRSDLDLESAYAPAYRRLRTIAARLLAHERRRNHTLQPTALVNESFFKLRNLKVPIESEDHLCHLSARAMRQVLVDHARRKSQTKRIMPAQLPDYLKEMHHDPDRHLALKLAWERLAKVSPAAAEIIRLRYFEGRSLADAAAVAGRDMWDARADCDHGIEWMADLLNRVR